MQALTKIRERLAPERRTFELFADVGASHTVTATIYRYPFHHLVIDNLLPQPVYEALARDFSSVLSRGISEQETREKFNRFDLYDLYSYVPKPTLDPPYGCFFAESYFQVLESALARTFTRDTFATFHHHTPNPKDNYIHNDYVYEYFAQDPLPNGTNAWYFQCNKYEPGEHTRPKIRAAAAIYYMNNEPWREGDGGETAIFATREKASLVRSVPPVNNRLLVFDITPASYHSYRACHMAARNSLAQWFFAEPEDASRRFPDAKPGGWERLREIGRQTAAGSVQ